MRERLTIPERHDVTVCIAAVCGSQSDYSIIEVADTLVSSQLGKNSRMKICPMPGGAFDVLIAGEDAEMNMGLDHLRDQFEAHKGAHTIASVTSLVRRALYARKRDKVEELIQGLHAIGYDEFRQSKDQFDSIEFANTQDQVRRCVLRAQFIVSGFAGETPVILQTTEKCEVLRRHDFAVIGLGDFLAQSMLLHREYARATSLERAIYACIEAKRFAEGETSVGIASMLVTRRAGQPAQKISDYGKKWYEEQFDIYGTKELPEHMKAEKPLIEDWA